MRKPILVLLLSVSPLWAGPRLFEIEKPLKSVMESVIDSISRELPFQVSRVYNGKVEGKEGFIITARPRNTRSEILFFARGAQSRVLVRSQDVHDSNKIARALAAVGFKEIGAGDKEIDGTPWPVRPF
ncbi:MAG: hypothetical protein HS115_16655 [Spirochaetales bacterium]|nr:hypothetical protein [Spirochaetales bacterium]